MIPHKTGTQKEWLAARFELLKAEKEASKRSDELARQRRELPWVKLEKQYRFETEKGSQSLKDLFCGRSQLVVYHFMFGPDYTTGCPTCSATADSFNGVLPHLEARDVTMICVSRAPLVKLLEYRKRMGWNFNWASSYANDFNVDFRVFADPSKHTEASTFGANEIAAAAMLNDPKFRENAPLIAIENAKSSGTDLDGYLSEGHGVSVFSCENENVYHTYSSYARGTEFLMGYYAILDRVPKGRDEDGAMGNWLRRHDEYGLSASKSCCA